MTLTVQVPDEMAAKLSTAKQGDTCAVELTVDANEAGALTGTATDVQAGEGEEYNEPAAPAAKSKMPPMVMDEMA